MSETEKTIKIPTSGSIPSNPDYRDKMAAQAVLTSMLAEASAGTLPQEFLTDLTALGEALDQNKIPACVSHAWALVIKYWWFKKTGEIVDFSPRFLDILSAEDWIPIDGGRVPRTVCKVSAKYGCCTTALLPNDTDGLSIQQYRDRSVLTDAMFAEAEKYKIPGYIRIPDDSISDFRGAVYQFGVMSGLFSISDAFWLPSWASADIDPLQVRTPTSNHQMVIKGWKDIYNVVQNSWSKYWNRNGDGTYKASSWLQYIWEGWAIAEVPNDVKAFLSDLPGPSDFFYEWNRTLLAGNAEPDHDVKMAQIFFMIHGFMDIIPAEHLGYFGPKTQQTVLKYQIYKKIFPTAPGSIGPKTRAAMNADASL